MLYADSMELDLENADGVYRGVDDVMGFFERTSFPAQAILTYTHVYETDESCVVELQGKLPAGNTVEALDIFTTGSDGRVVRMAVYARIAS